MSGAEILRFVEAAAIGSVLLLGGLTASIAVRYRKDIKEAEARKVRVKFTRMRTVTTESAQTDEQEAALVGR